VDLVF
jgi:dynein heavy chain 2, cytosolic